MASEQFCLKWNNFQTNIITNLENLKCNGDLVDVTLTCEGKSVKAHKVILSACSSYFRTIFKENPCPHPIVILKGVTHRDISSLISFMYQGEVHIQEDQLSSFLRTAEHLQIKGLADVVLPDEMLMSEALEKGNAPEAHSSPIHSPSSPTSTLASKPLQSMHVSEFPLNQDVAGGDAEAWRVNPKVEPMESESVGMQEQNEEAESQRIYSIDWRSVPPCSSDASTAPRLEIVQRRCPIERAQIPLLSGQQDPSFPCPLCDKVISSKSNLQKHMKIRHSTVITQEVCIHCGKVFKNKYSLKYHSTYHCVMNRSSRPL